MGKWTGITPHTGLGFQSQQARRERSLVKCNCPACLNPSQHSQTPGPRDRQSRADKDGTESGLPSHSGVGVCAPTARQAKSPGYWQQSVLLMHIYQVRGVDLQQLDPCRIRLIHFPKHFHTALSLRTRIRALGCVTFQFTITPQYQAVSLSYVSPTP